MIIDKKKYLQSKRTHFSYDQQHFKRYDTPKIALKYVTPIWCPITKNMQFFSHLSQQRYITKIIPHRVNSIFIGLAEKHLLFKILFTTVDCVGIRACLNTF